MSQSQRHDVPTVHVDAAHAGSQPQVEHAAAIVAAQRPACRHHSSSGSALRMPWQSRNQPSQPPGCRDPWRAPHAGSRRGNRPRHGRTTSPSKCVRTCVIISSGVKDLPEGNFTLSASPVRHNLTFVPPMSITRTFIAFLPHVSRSWFCTPKTANCEWHASIAGAQYSAARDECAPEIG